MNGWQPIETAPKDGTAVDLWVERYDITYRKPNCTWINRQWFDPDGWPSERNGIVATHWMPLPAPPVTP